MRTICSLLLLAAALPAAAETQVVPYLDYDAATRTFTNAVRECTVVTSATKKLTDGWYAVTDTEHDVEISGGTLTVEGSAHLIVCDGAFLGVTGEYGNPGIAVGTGSSLTIYGQSDGERMNMGFIWAEGAPGAAAIGGYGGSSSFSNCGTVTINGCEVWAFGGGGGGAGIGGGLGGSGGMVTISGGYVTARGKDGGEDIGHGYSVSEVSSGTVVAAGGYFNFKVPDDWCTDHSDCFDNNDSATSGDYPYVVKKTVKVTVGACPHAVYAFGWLGDAVGLKPISRGFCKVPPGTEDVRVVFAADPGYVIDGDEEVDLGTVTDDIVFGEASGFLAPHARCSLGDIDYIDWNGAQQVGATVSSRDYWLVTSETRVLSNRWYVVSGDVSIMNGQHLTVQGDVRLILLDGASLTIKNVNAYQPAIDLAGGRFGNRLAIYGQAGGTGRLEAHGGRLGAGIGSASIDYGGGNAAFAGELEIIGGYVTAIGGDGGAGIGGGDKGAGGRVTIAGGAVKAVHGATGSNPEDIGHGSEATDSGTVLIYGGIFASPIAAEWVAERFKATDNLDPVTMDAYPYMVVSDVIAGDSASFTGEITAGSLGSALASGTYIVPDSVSLVASAVGQSALSVEADATVVIYIPTNVTFTVTGANGSGTTPGGAGIRVPETATLVLTGEGSVVATGGKAGNGSDGGDAWYQRIKGSFLEVETPGLGGEGGGGAGAGIGGAGGAGGAGGEGSTGSNRDGAKGADGETCGTVAVLGCLTISASGGAEGSGGKGGSLIVSMNERTMGGGGGGRGMAAAAIGGGGAGGGGGGGGGWFTGSGLRTAADGDTADPGCGGESYGDVTYKGGAVGEGGGIQAFTISRASHVNVANLATGYANTHVAAQYTLALNDGGGGLECYTVTLGTDFPSIQVREREGYAFFGWRTRDEVIVYDYAGTAQLTCVPWPRDMTLLACWERTGEDVEIWENTVVVNGGDELVIDGKTICHAADGALFDVGSGGRLYLNNATIIGSVIHHKAGAGPAIRSDGLVVCSNCVFESILTTGNEDAAVYASRSYTESSALFVNCTFRSCTSAHELAGLYGPRHVFVNCTFADNYAEDSIIYVGYRAYATFVNCLLTANESEVGLGTAGSVKLYDSALVGNEVSLELKDQYQVKGAAYGWGAQVGDLLVTDGAAVSDQRPSTDAFVDGQRRQKVNGVEHSHYAPLSRLRIGGGYIWRSDDWATYSFGRPSDQATIPIEFDQLGGMATGYIGPLGGDLLQLSIDHPDENGVCVVPAGTYSGACVRPGDGVLEIRGAPGAVIDGEGELFGLYIDRQGVTVRGFEFRNCTFSRGGAISSVPANATFVEACRFEACSASDMGGALYGVTTARSCLFVGNSAVTNGGAVAETTCQNCTFVGNSVAGDTNDDTAAGHHATLVNCLLYQNAMPTADAEGGANVTAGSATRTVSGWPFVGQAGGSDYHLSFWNLAKLGVEATYLSDAEGWLDLDGIPYVHTRDGEVAYYLGCYAATPWKTGGNVVTDTTDGELDTGFKTTFREAIEYALEHPSAGAAEVTFADEIFGDRSCATIRLASAQIDLVAFTNVELAVRGPADGRTLVIDGDGQFRAFRVRQTNALRLENLTFENCFGSSYGEEPTPDGDGGAVLNLGTLHVSNCAFRCSSAGWPRYDKFQVPICDGGAIWNGPTATAIVERCTFAGNVAARGGAIANDGGFLTVSTSTFASNRIAYGMSVSAVHGSGYYQTGATADGLFVNCTFVDNVPHFAGEASIYVAGGVTNAVNLLADVPAADWFARLDGTGTNAVPVEATNGVRHLWYPLWEDAAAAAGQYVRRDARWENVCYGNQKLPALQRTVARGKTSAAMPLGLAVDQLGNAFATMVKGAVVLSEPRSIGPAQEEPSESVFDLVVREATEAALREVLRRAAEDTATYVSNGVVTVTFAEEALGATIDLSGPLVLDAFAGIPLVIKGPVILNGCGASPILKVGDGNRLVVKDIAFFDGRSEQEGGAISLGENCSLDADDCWFLECSAGESGGAISAQDGSRINAADCDFESCSASGLGGAVYLVGETSSARFAGGKFWSCASAADSPDFRTGNAVFADSTEVALVGCKVDDVEDLACGFSAWDQGAIDGMIPGYALARAPDGTSDLYWTGEAAAAEALEGDVLFLILPSSTEPDGLPPGVGIVDDFRWGHPADEWTTTDVTFPTYLLFKTDGDVFNCEPPLPPEEPEDPEDQNVLQELIDAAAPGATVVVPAGAYLGATVGVEKVGLVLRGASPADCVVCGGGTNLCLVSYAAGVKVLGISFAEGGVSNVAAYGCVFSNASVVAKKMCAARDSTLTGCLFRDCEADGGSITLAALNCAVRNCTFANCGRNAARGSTLSSSVFTGCSWTSDCQESLGTVKVADAGTAFVDAANGDWHLEAAFANVHAVTDVDYMVAALVDGWIGPDGVSIVTTTSSGGVWMTVGCYGFTQFYTLTKGDGTTTNFMSAEELAAYTNATRWFDYAVDGVAVTRALNELARPTITAIVLDDARENVFITPGALRPELWYGIRFAPTPTNEFQRIADGPWRQADGTGALNGPLVVPTQGRGEGFYRVEAVEVRP